MSMRNPQPSRNATGHEKATPPDQVPARKFTDGVGELRSLFGDPDARGARRWKDMFDTSRCDAYDLDYLLSTLPKI